MKISTGIFSLVTSVAIGTAVLAFSLHGIAQDDTNSAHPALFTENGEMQRPGDLDEWIFLGSTLGQGYNPAMFDPDSPGMFQVVRMEPAAYLQFIDTGEFPDGAMFSLDFYGVEQGASVTKSGYTMGELMLTEIHLKDAERFPESGFNFYMFPPGAQTAEPLDLPNDCVTCHTTDAAHDGVFTQFYPAARQRLEQAAARD
ncbi:cytochrome P460 family protein [Parvularcula flava]|uniref:Cytochrome P460 family protein n=1 Tax=Aquisalinus luteolus TaxID=1566827 RepID=A0A8J3ESJ5_9PROT|nr:cytochrome P460 family protein [Aquisalinus luteolus]NHK29612.1 cytochrome P460 family protein [Aquisalinus luteolus]GGI01411.1 hypothetical protein GCM10011355_31990 [Aquisalinus luteolus]